MKKPVSTSSRRARAFLLPALLIALVAGLGVGAGVHQAVTAGAHPLDPYPGFGRTPGAALRDDTIALWESYRREVIISDCMAYHDFSYWPQVAFPAPAVLEIAEHLGVTAAEVPGTDPEKRNREYRQGLSSGELDRYYRALWGESAADSLTFEATGDTPTGRPPEDFARGGCVGDAHAAVPGIWTAKRGLEDEFDRMREDALSSLAVQQARVEFSACMVQHSGHALEDPAAVEMFVSSRVDSGMGSTTTIDTVIAALEQCSPIWEQGYSAGDVEAAQQFVERNKPVLDLQTKLYHEGLMDQIRADDKFLAFLSQAAALSLLSLGEPG